MMEVKYMKKCFLMILIISLSAILCCCSSPSEVSKNKTPVVRNNNKFTPPLESKHDGNLIDFKMVDQENGWAISLDGILKTSDGGIVWSNVTPDEFKIKDGLWDGVTYDELRLGTPSYFKDKSTAWVIKLYEGKKAMIFHTSDGGAHWNQSSNAFNEVWEGSGGFISFPDDKNGFLLTVSSPACGLMAKAVYSTQDGGKTWRKVSNSSLVASTTTYKSLPGGGYPSGMIFTTAKHGLISYDNRGEDKLILYETKDGGCTWETININEGEKLDGYIGLSTYVPEFITGDTRDMLIIGKVNLRSKYLIAVFSYEDGGTSFNAKASIEENSDVYSIDGNRVYILSSDGSKLHILDENFTCKDISIKSPIKFTKIQFLGRYGWALNDGTLYRTQSDNIKWGKVN